MVASPLSSFFFFFFFFFFSVLSPLPPPSPPSPSAVSSADLGGLAALGFAAVFGLMVRALGLEADVEALRVGRWPLSNMETDV